MDVGCVQARMVPSLCMCRAARDINHGPFQNAATKLGVDESPYFKRLSFQMNEPSFHFPKFAESHFPKSVM